jgi:hypothetical protein
MMQYTTAEIQGDETGLKRATFYLTMKLAKNFRYKYRLVKQGSEFIDPNQPVTTTRKGYDSNYIEVGDDKTTIADFISKHGDDGE